MKTIKILLLLTAALLLLCIFAAARSPIRPAAWRPPADLGMTGEFLPNDRLKKARKLPLNDARGPEDVDLDAQGRIYGGVEDGRILRLDPAQGSGADFETFANTGGRPLGMHFDKDGNLIVADIYKGLLSVGPDGKITTLSTEADGVPFRFTDDLEIASDGTVYFSDASSKTSDYRYDLLEARPYGRLLSYSPSTGETKILLDGLYFANGIAVAPDGAFVLVNETYRYGIVRCWLKGPKAGRSEIFIDNLPGFPDGISSSGRGTFWLAFYAPRNGLLDLIHPYPYLKMLLAMLPESLQPAPAAYGHIAELDANGKILRTLQDPEGSVASGITSVQERDGALYLGSLYNPYIGKLDLSDID